MSLFNIFANNKLVEANNDEMEVQMSESVVKTSRFVRAHGKNPRGGYGNWMFTPKPTGDVNWNKEGDEYIQVAGDYKTAKAKAEKWAKDNGHKAVYVMESLNEAKKVVANVVLWNGKKMKKSFKNQSAAEAWVKKMKDEEDVRDYKMHAESAELDESFTDKEIKMAYGILNDPRYKAGNLTKAIDKIEKIKKGLSKHPGVQKAMKATSESVDTEDLSESTGAKFNNAMKQTMGAYDKRDLVKADRYLEKARQYLFSMRSTEYGKIDDKSYEQYKKLMKELRNIKIGESVKKFSDQNAIKESALNRISNLVKKYKNNETL